MQSALEPSASAADAGAESDVLLRRNCLLTPQCYYHYRLLAVCKQTWPSTILVVSHDREFLNSIATDILHLHSQRIEPYHGDYDTFVKTKTERLKNQQREYEAQKEYREHIQVSTVIGLLQSSFNCPKYN